MPCTGIYVPKARLAATRKLKRRVSVFARLPPASGVRGRLSSATRLPCRSQRFSVLIYMYIYIRTIPNTHIVETYNTYAHHTATIFNVQQQYRSIEGKVELLKCCLDYDHTYLYCTKYTKYVYVHGRYHTYIFVCEPKHNKKRYQHHYISTRTQNAT